MNIVLLTIAWLLLVILGMPIGIALIVSCVVFFHIEGFGLAFSIQRMVDTLDSFPLLAVPLFILTATLLNTSGITTKMFGFAKTLVGHITGGLGHVNVLASLFFSGMSGSAMADSGGLGKLEITAMREAGYDDDFSGSVTAASSIIGPLIPPSITMVLYGVASNTSIGKLFLGGIIPGLLCTISLMCLVYYIAKKRKYPVSARSSFREIAKSFVQSFWALLTPFIIIGGIFGGIFSPTEAAGITVMYAVILGFFIYKDLTIKKFCAALYETAITSSSIGILIAGVGLFSYIIAREQVPQRLTESLLSITNNPIAFILMVNVLLFILGSFIESLVLLLVLVPILVPVATSYNIDSIHFGIIVVLNLMISILTPPMGVSLFVVSKVGNISFNVLAKAIWIWLIPLTVVLLLVSFFPVLSTYLPGFLR